MNNNTIQINIHKNELTKCPNIIRFKFDETLGKYIITYKSLLTKIKQKEKIKKNPTGVYNIIGTPINDEFICSWLLGLEREPEQDNLDIIYTIGKSKYIAKSLHQKVPIQIVSKDTYISPDAIKQLDKTSKRLGSVIKCFGMPDLHVGGFIPIGSIVYTNSIVYPDLVGSDIGCGMRFSMTNVHIGSNFDKISRNLSLEQETYHSHKNNTCFCDSPFPGISNNMLRNELETYHSHSDHEFMRSIGTVGGGNHFAEIQQITQVVDRDTFDSHNLDDTVYYTLVHSGSRGYGYDILQRYNDMNGLNDDTSKFLNYKKEHDDAMQFAELNRWVLTEKLITNAFGNNTTYVKICDVFHNFVTSETTSETTSSDNNKSTESIWIHRKGASIATPGELSIIPGSRGSRTYLVVSLDKVREYGSSLAHGAGRRLTRNSTHKAMERNDTQFLKGNIENNNVICDKEHLLYEEAPKCYKDIETVVSDMESFGLIRVVAILKPVLTYKTRNP